MVTADKVKQLRDKTGASIMECKNALSEARGDEDNALKILQEKGRLTAMKKSERKAEEGLVEAYIHTNRKVGVLLKLKCETDFVARNQEFKELAHEIAMHIAGMNSKDEKSLLEEPYVKNPLITIKDLINEKVAKLGENIKIDEFVRYEL
jgi:elongation factor Ts